MGKGSIYLRKDGRWEARISLGTGPNGKRQSRSFYGYTREEARQKLLAASVALEPLSAPVLTQMSV